MASHIFKGESAICWHNNNIIAHLVIKYIPSLSSRKKNKLKINRTFWMKELIDVQPGSDLSLNSSLSLTGNIDNVFIGWSCVPVWTSKTCKLKKTTKNTTHRPQTTGCVFFLLVFWLVKPRPHIQMKRGSSIQMRLLSVLVVCSLLCFCLFFLPSTNNGSGAASSKWSLIQCNWLELGVLEEKADKFPLFHTNE